MRAGCFVAAGRLIDARPRFYAGGRARTTPLGACRPPRPTGGFMRGSCWDTTRLCTTAVVLQRLLLHVCRAMTALTVETYSAGQLQQGSSNILVRRLQGACGRVTRALACAGALPSSCRPRLLDVGGGLFHTHTHRPQPSGGAVGLEAGRRTLRRRCTSVLYGVGRVVSC